MKIAQTPLPAFQVYGSVAFDGSGVGEKKYFRGAAGYFQQPGGHKSVAAIISFSAEDQDFARGKRGKFPVQKFSDGRACILHQLQAGMP